jgi:ABC-type uncharacterized transport system involved in gliding motility auxiliary subunit
LISIRPKDDAGKPIFLSTLQGNILTYGSLVILPSIILILGISVYVMRRLRG